MSVASEEELWDRLAANDLTLWPEGRASTSSLGWVDVARHMDRQRRELRQWAETIDQDLVVILGAGSEVLGAKVFGRVAASLGLPHRRAVALCDSVQPEDVTSVPFEGAFILVLDKQGTSLETAALLDYALQRNRDVKRYAFVTDGDTPLYRRGDSLRVQRVFTSTPDAPGTFGALSEFGAVAAALFGYDLEELFGRTMEIDRHDAVRLGIDIGEAALEGVDQLVLSAPQGLGDVSDYVAELFIESTAKSGRGVIPLAEDEDKGSRPASSGDERQYVPISIENANELGACLYRHQLAAAVAAHVLEVNPFDHRELDLLDERVISLLEDLPLAVPEPDDAEEFEHRLRQLADLRYLAVEVISPRGEAEALASLGHTLQDRFGLPVLCTDGVAASRRSAQLHLGGPSGGATARVTARQPSLDLPIPGRSITFATLSQTIGFAEAQILSERGRSAMAVEIDTLGDLQ